MGTTMKELGMDRLTPEQRVTLALEIWDSLDDARPAAHLTAEQRQELAGRDAELDADPAIGMSWEQVRSGVEGAALTGAVMRGSLRVPHGIL